MKSQIPGLCGSDVKWDCGFDVRRLGWCRWVLLYTDQFVLCVLKASTIMKHLESLYCCTLTLKTNMINKIHRVTAVRMECDEDGNVSYIEGLIRKKLSQPDLMRKHKHFIRCRFCSVSYKVICLEKSLSFFFFFILKVQYQ